MKNYNLILENIRLKHMERLYTEATTDLELIRGQRLINESILFLQNVLEEGVQDPRLILDRTAKTASLMPIAGTLIGGAIGNEVHGNDGINLTTGITTDPVRNEDDEYDLTGAGLGGLAGLAAGGKYLRSKDFRVYPTR